MVIRIEDESGKIDLNRADLATLESMLVSTGLPTDEAQHLAAAIADYRDPDDIKTPGGAEAFDYEAAGLRHGPKNGPFDSPEEVMQVLGMTPAILRAILPLITVHSPSGEVNRQAASPAVRRALPKTDFGGANQASPDAEGPAVSIATVVRVTAEATTPQRRAFHPRGRPPAHHDPDPALQHPELAPPLAGLRPHMFFPPPSGSSQCAPPPLNRRCRRVRLAPAKAGGRPSTSLPAHRRYILMRPAGGRHHRATVDLEALQARLGADYPVADLVARAVCSECGARWPKISITVHPEAPKVISERKHGTGQD